MTRHILRWGVPAAAVALGALAFAEHAAVVRRRAAHAAGPRRRVVIIGAGFGGLQAAMTLAGKPGIDLTVIDAQNHHLFQPLLYQVATAALSPADIAAPIRGVLPESDYTRVVMSAVDRVDTQARQVVCGEEVFHYDELIVATGSQSSYFGHPEWERAAPSLKTLADAVELRRRILVALEHAALTEAGPERDRLLRFVLIGGGPTGVEMAGAICELTQDVIRHAGRDYHTVDILLIEGQDCVLPGFPPDLQKSAADSLEEMGVRLRTGVKVTDIDHGVVVLEDERIDSATIIWTAGTEATPVADWLGVKAAKSGAIAVDDHLRVPERPGVVVIGDAALAKDADGKKYPALAPVAKQQGQYIARSILRRVSGVREMAPFRYHDYGSLATIGRHRAVAEFGSLHLTGRPAWYTWAVAHIFFLIGFRSRMMVMMNWAFAYVTNDRASRLIIQHGDDRVTGGREPPRSGPSQIGR